MVDKSISDDVSMAVEERRFMKTKLLVVVLGVAALVAVGCATQSAKPVAGMACAECGCGMMKADGGKPMMHMMMGGHGKAD